MGKSWSKPAWLILVSLVLLATACNSGVVSTESPPATELPPTTTLIATNIPVQNATLQPSPSARPQLISIVPTSRQQPGSLNLRYAYTDADAPELFNASAEGYELDRDFRVSTIELSYRWLGIGATERAYERIERHEDGFWRDGVEITTEAVDRLIQSINHLHREAYMMTSSCGSDDYPFWAIEMTDADGNIVLLYSDSNGENFAPWNVAYNGKIYAQFDGQIAIALADLFSTAQERLQASFCSPLGNPNYLPVLPTGDARNLMVGFSGLMPLYRDLFYWPDAGQGELRGRINGFDWSSTIGGKTIHWLFDLKSIELISTEGQVISCLLETSTRDDEAGMIYDHVFSCPVGEPGERLTYSYPIRINYTNPENQSHTLSGTLYGYWNPIDSLPHVPYPDEIAKILESAPQSADLINNHIVKVFYPFVEVNRTTGLSDHYWEGDVALFGQAQIGERVLPYSLTLFDITIEDGKLARWDIDEQELIALLESVLDQTITRRYLEAEPNPMLNLYYAETASYPIIDEEDFRPCDGLSKAHSLPLPGQPLRGFSFNSGESPNQMQLFFMDDRLWINNLSLYLTSAEDAFWLARLPAELQPKEADPFTKLSYSFRGSGVGVGWDENASEAEINQYKTLLDAWGVGTRDWAYDPGVTFQQVKLDLTPDGELRLVDCRMP